MSFADGSNSPTVINMSNMSEAFLRGLPSYRGILIAGDTASGKTTFLAKILGHLSDEVVNVVDEVRTKESAVCIMEFAKLSSRCIATIHIDVTHNQCPWERLAGLAEMSILEVKMRFPIAIVKNRKNRDEFTILEA